MSFLRLLNFDCVQIGSDAKNKEQLLKEIASIAKKNPVLNDLSEADIFSALKAREEIGSTGFDNKIAIPHCSFDSLKEFVVGLIAVKDGIDFQSIDGRKSEVFFFIIGPKAKRNKHIKILSAISKVMKYKKRVQEIIDIPNKENLVKYLYSIFDEKEFDQGHKEKCILNIFVQNEEYFSDILELISSEVEGSISVVETNNAGYYLHKLPLFSGFWTEEQKIFMKVITAIVDKALANDLIRRIHTLCNNLNSEPGILITAQDLFYSAGSINF